ncbi:MAG: GGDEF domain-containing protein [Limimaricola soesokkakensis]|uniref:GGDEF domain-containing protein n=1 Tax=Limimaricola soesokkakensis TaxID=1343159 RepID=UPI00405902F6
MTMLLNSLSLDGDAEIRDLCSALGSCAGVPARLRLLPALSAGQTGWRNGAAASRVIFPVDTDWMGELTFDTPEEAELSEAGRRAVQALLPLAGSLLSAAQERRRLKASLDWLRDHNMALRRRTRHDPLTGLLNGRSFHAMARLMSRQPLRKRASALMLIDADEFKGVNDRFGHPAGDRYLKALARSLRDLCRPEDPVGRIGGDEFALFLHDVPADRDWHAVMTDRLRARLRHEVHLAVGPDCPASVSVGIAVFETPRGDYAALLKEADTALYAAKAERQRAAK